MSQLTTLERQVCALLGTLAALLESPVLDELAETKRGIRERCDAICREMDWNDLADMVGQVRRGVVNALTNPQETK